MLGPPSAAKSCRAGKVRERRSGPPPQQTSRRHASKAPTTRRLPCSLLQWLLTHNSELTTCRLQNKQLIFIRIIAIGWHGLERRQARSPLLNQTRHLIPTGSKL